jgi:tetratricopeptide (TPR) repeat protein
MGNHAEAIGYLRRAYELSKDGEVAAHLGEVLWASGERDAARQIWQRALKDHPEHPKLLETLQRHQP